MTCRDRAQDRELDQLRADHQAADGVTTDALGTIAAQVRALQAQVAEQTTALRVLTQLLLERGALDAATLQSRYAQATTAAKAEANLIPCIRCAKKVDRRQTQLTSSGAMCSPCYETYSADD